MTNTTDPLARYHHPHFISVEPISRTFTSGRQFRFRPFTGLEPKPETPDLDYRSDIPVEAMSALADEYRAARIMWGKARFRRAAAEALPKAEPVWKNYLRAREIVDGLYASFDDLDDNQWRSTYLRLGDAQDEALSAAQRWDDVAEGLATLQDEHLREVGESNEELLRDIAPEIGMSIGEWHIGYWCSLGYRPRYAGGLYERVQGIVGEQRERLGAVIAAFSRSAGKG